MAAKATRLLASGGLFLIDVATGQTNAIGSTTAGVTRLTTYGSDSGYYAALAGGTTVYAVNDSVNGQEVWVTDGTTGGTHLLAALAPGAKTNYPLGLSRISVTVSGSFARNFAVLDPARALFTAAGNGLWTTDGTAASTRLVTSAVTASPTEAIVALGDGRALFTGLTDAGYELWITDGTSAGTRLVKDLLPGASALGLGYSSYPRAIVSLGGGRAIFGAADSLSSSGLWITDGTAAGTSEFATGINPLYMTRLGNGLVVFENTDVAHGTELWITDGTAAGTRLLVDTVPGSTAGLANNPVSGFGLLGSGKAVFFVDASGPSIVLSTSKQLWITDGTVAGTSFVKTISANSTSFLSAPPGFTQLADGRVAFYGDSSGTASTVWVSDGTAAGTLSIGSLGAGQAVGGLSGAALVDAPFYYQHYADVAAAGAVSAARYDAYGWHEGRDPDAYFSTPGYLQLNKDVLAAGIDPLTHYDAVGWKEGRDPSAAFDTNLYLLFNPDVRAAGIDPLAHWLADGQAEGRTMSAVVDSGKVRDLFDPTFYGLSNSDVTAARVDLNTHFNTVGATEGRNPDAYLDVRYYLAQNPDVAASGINPVAHYLNRGWKEGRDPSTHFSTTKYLAAYGDVKAAGINPLAHFLQSGIIEGRSGFGDRL